MGHYGLGATVGVIFHLVCLSRQALYPVRQLLDRQIPAGQPKHQLPGIGRLMLPALAVGQYHQPLTPTQIEYPLADHVGQVHAVVVTVLAPEQA